MAGRRLARVVFRCCRP